MGTETSNTQEYHSYITELQSMLNGMRSSAVILVRLYACVYLHFYILTCGITLNFLFGTQIHLLQPSFRCMSEIHHFSDHPTTCSYSCLIYRVVHGGLNHLVGPGYLLHYSAKSCNPLTEYLRTMRNQ